MALRPEIVNGQHDVFRCVVRSQGNVIVDFVVDAAAASAWNGGESYLLRELTRHIKAWAFNECQELFDSLCLT